MIRTPDLCYLIINNFFISNSSNWISKTSFKLPFQVIITISDVNDRKPVFEERLPDESCYVITEFHDLTESVLTIRASDGDDPQTPNGQLAFLILDGNDEALFRLESAGMYTL